MNYDDLSIRRSGARVDNGRLTFTPWLGGGVPPRSLATDEVEVWALRLDVSEDTLDWFAGSLDTDEDARARRFRFAHDRGRFQVTRGALRHLLSLYIAVGPDQHQFAYEPRGKPSLRTGGHPAILFNLAHAGELAVFAFAMVPVGIDVEPVRAIPDVLTIARAAFSPSEYAALVDLPEEERLRAFFHCWTGKEAYVKALGEGLSLPLESFEASSWPGDKAEIVAGSDRGMWSLYHFEPADGYLGALAVPGRNHTGKGWLIEAAALRE